MRFLAFLVLIGSISVSCNSGSTSNNNHNALGALADTLSIQGAFAVLGIQDGDSIPSDFKFEIIIDELINEPAGVVTDTSGHFHALIGEQFVEKGKTLIANGETHFCLNGRLSAGFELPSGTIIVGYQYVDGEHRSYGFDYSKAYKVNVAEPAESISDSKE